jgi:hypothetical protein
MYGQVRIFRTLGPNRANLQKHAWPIDRGLKIKTWYRMKERFSLWNSRWDDKEFPSLLVRRGASLPREGTLFLCPGMQLCPGGQG